MNPRVSRNIPLGLPPEVYETHQGKWIALAKDGVRIIASAADLDSLEDALAAAGMDPEKVILDRVEDDDVCLGGAELL